MTAKPLSNNSQRTERGQTPSSSTTPSPYPVQADPTMDATSGDEARRCSFTFNDAARNASVDPHHHIQRWHTVGYTADVLRVSQKLPSLIPSWNILETLPWYACNEYQRRRA